MELGAYRVGLKICTRNGLFYFYWASTMLALLRQKLIEIWAFLYGSPFADHPNTAFWAFREIGVQLKFDAANAKITT